MGRSQSKAKTKMLATRVTPKIFRIIKAVAASEGLYTSEWVRKVILEDLKESKVLKTSINHPIIEERPL